MHNKIIGNIVEKNLRHEKGGVDLENIKKGAKSGKLRVVLRTIFMVSFILSVISAIALLAIYKYRQSDDFAKYTEKGCSSYEVVLKEDYNPYGDGIATSNMQYLSSKLEGLNANLYYKLNMKQGSHIEYKYSYTLKEVVQVVSKETGKTIIGYENLIKTETVNSVKADELKIGETHYLDYAHHDTMITEFINQQSDLRTHAVTCTLKLVLEINLKGVCQDFEDELSKHPTVYISVPLTTDTVSISSGSNITKGEGKIVLCKNLSNDKPFLVASYVCMGGAVLLLVLWYVYRKMSMSQDDKFAKTTNKIKSNYGSYIQEINQPISQNYEQVVEFNKFIDLLEVSNIIKQPVFIEKQTDDETVYVVPESTTRIYKYVLNRDKFAKKPKKEKPAKPAKADKVEDLDEPKQAENSVRLIGASVQVPEPEVEMPAQEEPKNEKPAKLKKEKHKKDKHAKEEDEFVEPKLEEGPVEEAILPDRYITSAKINRTMMHYRKQTTDKDKIYDIIDKDIEEMEKQRMLEYARELFNNPARPAGNVPPKTAHNVVARSMASAPVAQPSKPVVEAVKPVQPVVKPAEIAPSKPLEVKLAEVNPVKVVEKAPAKPVEVKPVENVEPKVEKPKATTKANAEATPVAKVKAETKAPAKATKSDTAKAKTADKPKTTTKAKNTAKATAQKETKAPATKRVPSKAPVKKATKVAKAKTPAKTTTSTPTVNLSFGEGKVINVSIKTNDEKN